MMWWTHKHAEHGWVNSQHSTDPAYLDGYSYPTEKLARKDCLRLIAADLQLMATEKKVWAGIMLIHQPKGKITRRRRVQRNAN